MRSHPGMSRLIRVAIVVVAAASPVFGQASRPTPAPASPPPAADAARARLARDVTKLASPELGGRFGPPAAAARAYIAGEFEAAGISPLGGSWEHPFSMSGMKGINLIGVRPSTAKERSGRHVIVSAHYDHLGRRGGTLFPGASDNASGVAAMLELARRSKDMGAGPHDLVFIAFDLEEQGLLGSFAYAEKPPLPLERCQLFVTMDILGRRGLGLIPDLLFVQGWEWAPERMLEPLKRADAESDVELAYFWTDIAGDRSDFVAFKRKRIPHLFFSTGEHSDYHEPTDTADRLDFAALARDTDVIERALRGYLGQSEPIVSGAEPVRHLIEFESLQRLAKALLKSDDEHVDDDLKRQAFGLGVIAAGVVKRGKVAPNDRKMLRQVAKRLQSRKR